MNTLFTEPDILRAVLYIAIALAYVTAIIVIRWNLIAVPLRHHLKVAIESGRSSLRDEGSGMHGSDSYQEVDYMLNGAEAQLRSFD